jgi:hypothetical protein
MIITAMPLAEYKAIGFMAHFASEAKVPIITADAVTGAKSIYFIFMPLNPR